VGSQQAAGGSSPLKGAGRGGAEQIEIRPCDSLAEFDRCVELQRLVWGFADVDIVPSALFVVAAHTGGHVFGAYHGDEMVGFVMAFGGYRDGRALLHSHMAAVLPAYQGSGVGRRLKWRQRDDALARGIRLVEWTFDPLEIRNAHFNLERLGAIARHYLPNAYGQTTSPLHAVLPTDRLLAEWWLDTARVEARAAGKPRTREAVTARIRVPGKISQWRHASPAAAAQAQTEIREQFQQWFGRGDAAIGFEVDATSGDGVYLLGRYED